MKHFFLCLTAVLFAVSCGDRGDVPATVDMSLSIARTEYAVPAAGQTVCVDITTAADFAVDMPAGATWIKVSEKIASTRLQRYFDVEANGTYDDRRADIVFVTADKVRHKVTVTQSHSTYIDVKADERYDFECTGGTLSFDIEHSANFGVNIPATGKGWIKHVDGGGTTRGIESTTLNFDILPNIGSKDRSSYIQLVRNGLIVRSVYVGQARHTSSDFSQDGVVTVLQEKSEGKGIDIVVMGDGYTDVAVNDGSYMAAMRKAVEFFFETEPHNSFRKLYNVYVVTTVSKNGFNDTNMRSDTDEETALMGYFGDGTIVGGNANKCISYARKAIGTESSRMDQVLMIVVMNTTTQYSGTCHMWTSSTKQDTGGGGMSIAYQSLYTNDTDFKGLIQHECGHGFAKLHDEYIYSGKDEYGTNYSAAIGQKARADRESSLRDYGWWKNIDFTSDRTQVRWAKYLADTRYSGQLLGVFQGAQYSQGIYSATDNSIMKYNKGQFNAPSREAIYYRIHKLAYGSAWKYDHETFVTHDAVSRTRSAGTRSMVERTMPPTAPPVVNNYPWWMELEKK